MLEVNTNNLASNKSYVQIANFSNFPGSASLDVDSTMLENALKKTRQMDEIAVYVDMKAQRNLDAGPQLTPPSVKITDDDTGISSLKNLLATIEEAKQTNSFNSESLKSRLETINETTAAHKAEVDRSWNVFEQSHADLLQRQDELEQVVGMLVNLQVNPNITKVDLDNAAKIANNALTNVGIAMTKLDTNIDALLNTADQKHANTVEKAVSDFYALKDILIKIQLVMKANKIAVMQGQSDLFVKQQDAIMTKLNKKGDDVTVAQKKKETFMEVMKYFAMALGVGLSAMAGGEAGAIGVVVSLALIGGDMATDGAISKAVIEPMLMPLMKGIEAIAAFYGEILKSLGLPEIAAMLMSAAATIGSLIGGFLILKGAAASEAGQAIGKAIGEFAEALATKVMEKVAVGVAALQASKSILAQAVVYVAEAMMTGLRFIADVFASAGKFIDESLEFFLGSDKIERWSEWYLNMLKEAQATVMAVGVAVESGLTTATAYTEKDEKDLQAAIGLSKTVHDMITKALQQIGETWASQIKTVESFIKIASRLERTRAQVALSGYRGIAA